MRYEHNLQQPHFTVENIDILTVSREENYRHSYRNGRLKHGFIYVVKGEMCDIFFKPIEQSIHIKEGELIFIPKGCSYIGTYLGVGTQIRIVQFDIAQGMLPSYFSTPQKISLPDTEELINAFFEPMRTNQGEHPFYAFSCLYRLLWQIDENYSKLPTKYRKLQPAMRDMSAHYEKNAPISQYAELCGMSEVNFRRLFREYTQKSPVEYRNDLRLEHAKVKLQSGEYNVSEAAEDSGFSNLSFFIRLYKKKYGHTPKKE